MRQFCLPEDTNCQGEWTGFVQYFKGFIMRYKVSSILSACCLFLALAGVASAAHDGGDDGVQHSPTGAKADTHIYIVQMAGDPILAYDGNIRGYQATKPGKGNKINPNSAHVKKYAARLADHQDQMIHLAGGTKVYNYRFAFNGFAARMSATDAQALRGNPAVLNVWKDEIMKIQTDTSPAYLGLTKGNSKWKKGFVGEDIVIAVIDTGVWPEHPSFADVKTPKNGDKGDKIPYGTAPNFTPSGCDFGNMAANPADIAFSCNNKLVAARCYNSGFSSGPDASNPCGGNGAFTGSFEFQSPRDVDGHGSHTASTAGGNNGVQAFIAGEALGKVSGIAPRARIAAYKVCWDGPDQTSIADDGCASSDSAAAIDQAAADGADVINFSIGGSSNSFTGPDDIAFLFAADAGVFVATSNGNSGPDAGTVGTPSGVPWITAVGASQDDGVFNLAITANEPASVAGDYVALEGAGDVTLADSGVISADVTLASTITACDSDGPNDPISGIALVSRGVCAFSEKYNNAAAAGASAIVVFNDGANSTRMDPIVMSAPGTTIPGVMISYSDGFALAVESGVHATMDANYEVSAESRIASFSSRGPNNGELDIIKPDVAAPGVAILAAETPANGRNELFQSISGTSMASPHVAGAFALLKQAHPDWSPAMARSALMTTARQDLNKTFGDTPATPFDIGAGEILPGNAREPTLVYDADIFDYVRYTCGSSTQRQIFTQGTCDAFGSIDPSDLNLPSIGIGELVGQQTITRTVTSVAKDNGKKKYWVSVDAPAGIDVSVSPSQIRLRRGESASYEVTFTVTDAAVLDEWAFGSLGWSDEKRSDNEEDDDASDHDGEHDSVRSPIAVRPIAFAAPANVGGAVTDGTLSYGVSFGYEGGFNVNMDGLDEGEGQDDVVADGGNTLHFFFVPPGTTLARFSLFDSEIGAQNDLDLQIQGPHTEGYPFVCYSGTGTSEEQCDLVNPAPGFYAAFVIDYSSEAGLTPYTLWNFNLDSTDAGNTTITAPASATLGTTGDVTINWSGLTPGARHLGIVSYDDGVIPLSIQTEVMIKP